MLLFLLHYMFKINIFLIEIQKHNLVNQEKKKKNFNRKPSAETSMKMLCIC